jgi:hypothetical protein
VNLPGAVGTLPAAVESVNDGDDHDYNDIILFTVMMMMMMMMMMTMMMMMMMMMTICHCV